MGLFLGSLFCSLSGYKLILNHNCSKCSHRKAQDAMKTHSREIWQDLHFFALFFSFLSFCMNYGLFLTQSGELCPGTGAAVGTHWEKKA